MEIKYWTLRTPQKDGWYWALATNTKEIVHVQKNYLNGGFVVEKIGVNNRLSLHKFIEKYNISWWQGPIEAQNLWDDNYGKV